MNGKNKKQVVIVGGGAAGFFTAINLAESAPQTDVTIVEGSARLLTKVKISGGGRCNVTHHCFDVGVLLSNYPRGFRELRGPFTRFQPLHTVEWFKNRGVFLKAEEDGRMFSTTNKSQTIIDCLRQAASEAGVTVRTSTRVVSVSRLDKRGFRLKFPGDETLDCDALMLATGSAPGGYTIAEFLGHSIEKPVPSLFTFNCPEDLTIRDLAGISVPRATLLLSVPGSSKTFSQSGPLLITHWGLSGPAVLKLSAFAARELWDSGYKGSLKICWLPPEGKDRIFDYFHQLRASSPGKTMAKLAPEGIPKRLWQRFLEICAIDSDLTVGQLPKKMQTALIREMTDGTIAVDGKGVFKEEFVTCGGVSLREVDFRTMESRICPGLYFAGEILDIDGVTGGFNFQNAWTTGWIASKNMAEADD